MEDITYIALIDKTTAEGHKAAKISQDKITNIRNFRAKEQAFNPAPAPTVAITPAPAAPVAPAPVAAEPIQEVKAPEVPVTPAQTVTEPVAPVVTKANNYGETIQAFMIECYKNDAEFLGNKVSLESARKLRVNPTVTKHIQLMNKEYGVMYQKPATAVVEEAPVVDEPQQETISVKLENNHVPNVDDYLQQGNHVNIDDIDYAQLSGAELSSLIDRVTDDLNKTEQANQHKREEQDRLNKTMVLKDLVEKLKLARAEEKALNEDIQQGKSL